MKQNLASLLLAVLTASLLLATAHAQGSFYGSDNFNDNSFASGRWNSFGTTNGGLWSEANGRMEFTANASDPAIITSNRAAQFTLWSNSQSGNTSYTDSWNASMSFTIDNAAVATNGAVWLGLEVSAAAAEGGYYGIYLLSATSGARLFTEQGIWNGSDYNRTTLGSTGNLDLSFDVTDVLLRISYDGSTKALTTAYSFDAGDTFLNYSNSSNPGHFGAAASGSASSWNPAPTGGFGLELYGALYGNGSNPGPTLLSGQAFGDNLSVSAIPEPSTYAAFAGLGALGLACWRRRARA